MTGEVWTIAEQKDNQLREVSFELLAWGRKLANLRATSLCAVVLENGMANVEFKKVWR
jgi:electron transfer flavoprotein alpha subunit